MYVREYFQESARQAVKEMVNDLRNVFTELIDNVPWMDNSTRERAKEKAAVMTTHIAYPDELLDDKKLAELYANVKTKTSTDRFCISNVAISDVLLLAGDGRIGLLT